ncbi:MAG: dockerin type I domain-containing protein [Candidatus Zixiibacteriota bacterium]
MRLILSFLGVVAVLILWPTGVSLGQCPVPNDNGICDTVSVQGYPPDLRFTGAGQLVRVPIFVTHDVTGDVDSLAAVLIPLCYTHTNPTKYCSLSTYWNTLTYTSPRGILSDLDATTHNYIKSLESHCVAYPLSGLALDVSTAGRYFRLSWMGASDCEQRWGSTNHALSAIMTFRVEDTMTVCLDTCFWPGSGSLKFTRGSDAASYIPRDNMPYCFTIYASATGDPTGDGVIDAGDVVFLINYLFREGPAPAPLRVGDANCDQLVDSGDVVFLINYLFKSGSAPSC